jgi:GAF domain-containing protein
MKRHSNAGSKVPKMGRRKAAKTERLRSSPGASQNAGVAQLTRELKEAREHQAANAEVLRIIASSAADLQSVLNTLLEKATRLCQGERAAIFLPKGVDDYVLAASAGHTEESKKYLGNLPIKRERGSVVGRVLLQGETVHIPNVAADPEYTMGSSRRTLLGVPLLRQGMVVGVLVLARSVVRPFNTNQIELVTTFANQAVIAIENARLFNETREALERQTATADILKVIASSLDDVQPVFQTIADRSNRLVNALSTTVFTLTDGMLYLRAFTPTTPEADTTLQATFPAPLSAFSWGESIGRGDIYRIIDAEQEPQHLRDLARRRGWRSALCIPLLRDGKPIGMIGPTRVEPGPFADHHVQLMKTFADQAVIAIENARLFNEVQAKTRDLEESLQQQTATAEVLKVISRSAFDLQSVLQTLVESVRQLLSTDTANIYLREGDVLRVRAHTGMAKEFYKFLQERPVKAERGRFIGRAFLTAEIVHLPDVLADPEYSFPGGPQLGGYRAVLGVPMIRNGRVEGVFGAGRTTPGPFTAREIELVRTFADQALIAVENARLFNEVQERTVELSEALEQQTATADVLKVISASSGELGPVFDKMLENATRVCGAGFGSMVLVEGDMLRQAAFYNAPAELAAVRTNEVRPIHPLSGIAAAVRSKHVVQVEDIRRSPAYLSRARHAVELAELGGARTLAVVPMVLDDEAIGVITVYRQEVRLFGEKQIDLLTNFARQAVIAIENARLLGELRQRTADLSKSLDNLRAAQDRLVQTEKLASLGQLTAGIAHEIKNPLNFVNNFAGLSVELTDELKDVLMQERLTDKGREQVDALTGLLKDNLGKVVQHGKRADSIVKNMLLHSREGSGERRSVDINALVGESLNLAYHGARAEKAGFSITLKHDLDPEAGAVDLYPQEITRALLNLISNGFYAATRRKAEAGDDSFEPVLSAATRNLGKTVEIRVRDNGTGISPEVREKMFNPFFTTKPTGEGTGLGLSMTHDIIVKQHGGRIDVETEPGVFAEFIVTLPRGNVNAIGEKPE